MAHGTHDFEDDPRNEQILIWVNGELLPRHRAVVSVFDSGFVLGDGVWEGLRGSAAATPPSSTATSTGCSRARRRSCSTSA